MSSQILTVFLTTDSSEISKNLLNSFLLKLTENESHEHFEIKILSIENLLIDKNLTDVREVLLAKSFEKIINNKNPSSMIGNGNNSTNNSKNEKNEKNKVKKEEISLLPKIYLLHNYPTTEKEMIALMDQRFKYPLLDSVIKIVQKSDNPLIT